MGAYSGPELIDSGLVLALDAADSNSYDEYENLVGESSIIGKSGGAYVNTGSVVVTLNSTGTTSPNNLNEATLIDNNGNSATNYVYSGAFSQLTANTTYTYSIHIKQGTKPDFQITIDEAAFGGKRYYSIFTFSTETVTSAITGATNDGVLVGSSATKLTNGWYRLSITFTTSSTNVSYLVDMINRFGTSGTNYVWGRQLEKGNTVTDYYATTTSVKNRGTTWIDLTGRSNTATLTNGPGFDNANRGSIVFNGTNQYAPIGTTGFPFGSSAGTLSAWAKTNTTSGYAWIISYGTSTTSQSRFIGRVGSTYYFGGYSDDITASGVVANTWFNMTGVYDGSNALLYINGVLVSGPTAKSWNTVANTAQLGRQTYPAEYWNGNIGQVLVYNRALTASEVLQNYNTNKFRFGIS